MSTPRVSIIIPTRDRPHAIRACLAALGRLRTDASDFEAIVVDDGSRIPVTPAFAPHGCDLQLTVLRRDGRGPAAARNAGAAVARGMYLAFTDDDCTPDPDWLDALVRRLEACPDAMVGGRTINALDSNPFAEASQQLVSFFYDRYTGEEGSPRFLTSNNLALAAVRFRALGGFDAAFPLAAGEDRDFGERWTEAGGRILLAPEAVVHHAHPLTPRSFWDQHFRYGRGAYQLRRRARRRTSVGVRFEPISFYGALVTYPLQRAPTRRALTSSALLFIAQVANTCGYAWEALAERP